MKYFFLFILFATTNISQGQGIDFFHGTWEETLAEANEKNKLIFVDAYAVWCGPCKKMSKQVFPQDKVGEYFNTHFVSLKMDMEKGEGPKFGRKYPVKAYPTFLFISPSGEVVLSVTGFRQADAFIEVARKAVERYDPSTELAKQFEKGDRSFETVLAYVKSLNNSGKSSLAISNQYLREKEDLTEEQKLAFIFEAAIESDSRLFDLFIENRTSLNQLKSKEEVDQHITRACSNTVKKAIEFEMVELLKEAQMKYKDNLPESADHFIMESDLKFASETNQPGMFIDASKNYLSKVEGNDQLNHICRLAIKHFSNNSEVLVHAKKIAKKEFKKNESSETGYNYAKILHLSNEPDKAQEVLDKTISLSGPNPTRDILLLKKELENS